MEASDDGSQHGWDGAGVASPASSPAFDTGATATAMPASAHSALPLGHVNLVELWRQYQELAIIASASHTSSVLLPDASTTRESGAALALAEAESSSTLSFTHTADGVDTDTSHQPASIAPSPAPSACGIPWATPNSAHTLRTRLRSLSAACCTSAPVTPNIRPFASPPRSPLSPPSTRRTGKRYDANRSPMPDLHDFVSHSPLPPPLEPLPCPPRSDVETPPPHHHHQHHHPRQFIASSLSLSLDDTITSHVDFVRFVSSVAEREAKLHLAGTIGQRILDRNTELEQAMERMRATLEETEKEKEEYKMKAEEYVQRNVTLAKLQAQNRANGPSSSSTSSAASSPSSLFSPHASFSSSIFLSPGGTVDASDGECGVDGGSGSSENVYEFLRRSIIDAARVMHPSAQRALYESIIEMTVHSAHAAAATTTSTTRGGQGSTASGSPATSVSNTAPSSPSSTTTTSFSSSTNTATATTTSLLLSPITNSSSSSSTVSAPPFSLDVLRSKLRNLTPSNLLRTYKQLHVGTMRIQQNRMEQLEASIAAVEDERALLAHKLAQVNKQSAATQHLQEQVAQLTLERNSLSDQLHDQSLTHSQFMRQRLEEAASAHSKHWEEKMDALEKNFQQLRQRMETREKNMLHQHQREKEKWTKHVEALQQTINQQQQQQQQILQHQQNHDDNLNVTDEGEVGGENKVASAIPTAADSGLPRLSTVEVNNGDGGVAGQTASTHTNATVPPVQFGSGSSALVALHAQLQEKIKEVQSLQVRLARYENPLKLNDAPATTTTTSMNGTRGSQSSRHTSPHAMRDTAGHEVATSAAWTPAPRPQYTCITPQLRAPRASEPQRTLQLRLRCIGLPKEVCGGTIDGSGSGLLVALFVRSTTMANASYHYVAQTERCRPTPPSSATSSGLDAHFTKSLSLKHFYTSQSTELLFSLYRMNNDHHPPPNSASTSSSRSNRVDGSAPTTPSFSSLHSVSTLSNQCRGQGQGRVKIGSARVQSYHLLTSMLQQEDGQPGENGQTPASPPMLLGMSPVPAGTGAGDDASDLLTPSTHRSLLTKLNHELLLQQERHKGQSIRRICIPLDDECGLPLRTDQGGQACLIIEATITPSLSLETLPPPVTHTPHSNTHSKRSSPYQPPLSFGHRNGRMRLSNGPQSQRSHMDPMPLSRRSSGGKSYGTGETHKHQSQLQDSTSMHRDNISNGVNGRIHEADGGDENERHSAQIVPLDMNGTSTHANVLPKHDPNRTVSKRTHETVLASKIAAPVMVSPMSAAIDAIQLKIQQHLAARSMRPSAIPAMVGVGVGVGGADGYASEDELSARVDSGDVHHTWSPIVPLVTAPNSGSPLIAVADEDEDTWLHRPCCSPAGSTAICSPLLKIPLVATVVTAGEDGEDKERDAACTVAAAAESAKVQSFAPLSGSPSCTTADEPTATTPEAETIARPSTLVDAAIQTDAIEENALDADADRNPAQTSEPQSSVDSALAIVTPPKSMSGSEDEDGVGDDQDLIDISTSDKSCASVSSSKQVIGSPRGSSPRSHVTISTRLPHPLSAFHLLSQLLDVPFPSHSSVHLSLSSHLSLAGVMTLLKRMWSEAVLWYARDTSEEEVRMRMLALKQEHVHDTTSSSHARRHGGSHHHRRADSITQLLRMQATMIRDDNGQQLLTAGESDTTSSPFAPPPAYLCYSCSSSFSFFRRAYSCRLCGLWHCDSCSSKRIDVHLLISLAGCFADEMDVRPNEIMQRCCDRCFAITQAATGANR